MAEIQPLLEEIEQALKALPFPAEPKELYNPIRYTLADGGKRMRPLLVLMGCKIFSEDVKDAVHPALGIEVFHNFTLLHDDIMDNAPIRRGKPAVHKKWNSNIAILSGDVMMILAYQELINTRTEVLRDILNVFNKTAIEVCEGQQLDMNYEQQMDVSIADYLNMIRLKTAVVVGAGLKVGAIIGGGSPAQAEILYQFGVNTGLAFQLQDDILDVYGNSHKVGKQQGGDILSNKKTFMLLKALEIANPSQKQELMKWLDQGLENPKAKIEGVMKIYDELEIRKLAEQKMSEHYALGMQGLQELQGDQKWISALRKFTQDLMHRES
ncbi:polyprenyl synthetase family protein [Bacteroidota bacterium]